MPTPVSSMLGWLEGAAAYALGSWAVQASLLLAAGLLLARLPRLRPAHRHALLLATLCLAAAAPLGLVLPSPLRVQASLPAAFVRGTELRHAARGPAGIRPPAAAPSASAPHVLVSRVPAGSPVAWVAKYPALGLCGLWLVVVGARLLLLCVSARQVAQWVRRGSPLDRDRLYAACGYRIADIPVLETPAVQVPSVVGTWRPVILLPTGLSERIEAGALGHVLFHEEGHARRRDPLGRLVSTVAEILLFWHPLVPAVRHQLEVNAEDACDAHALERGANRAAYARTLLSVLEMALAGRSRSLACRLGRRGSELKRRVTRILTGGPAPSPVLGYLSLGAMLPTLGASALLEIGPRPDSPLGLLGLQAFRRSGLRAFAPTGVQAFRPSGLQASFTRTPGFPAAPPVRAAGTHPLIHTSTHPHTPTHSHPYVETPTSLPIKPGTRRALPGSVPVRVGSGMAGGSRDVGPRRDHLTVFLLDISSGVAHQQAEARRQIMLRIAELPAGDRFNVVAFNSRVLPYASSPLTRSEETVASIRSWLEVLPQEAGVGLAAGLRHALAQEGVTSVILFSDRNASWEISSRPEILAVLERENPSSARILAVAPETPQQQQLERAALDPQAEPSRPRATERPGGADQP